MEEFEDKSTAVTQTELLHVDFHGFTYYITLSFPSPSSHFIVSGPMRALRASSSTEAIIYEKSVLGLAYHVIRV
jgi:hypothetical protein